MEGCNQWIKDVMRNITVKNNENKMHTQVTTNKLLTDYLAWNYELIPLQH